MGDIPIRPELFSAAQALLVDYLGFSSTNRLLISTDTAADQAVVQAVSAAALCAGGRPVVLTLPQLPLQGKLADPFLPEPLAGAVDRCDMWIDLTFPYIAGSNVHDQAMKKGMIKYLLASDLNAEGLLRLFGRVDMDGYFRVQAGFDVLIAEATGKAVRITTALGTDVTFKLAKPTLSKPRRAHKPGMYLVPGAATMIPEIETVRGQIAIETVFHEYYTLLRSPILLEIDGRIRSVRGGGPERAVLERALRRAGGGEFGYIIHFTHGLHPAARFSGRSFVEDMRVTGNDAVGMGLPWWLPGGGENHPDGVLSMQSIWIDDKQIVADGAIVAPGDLATAAAGLVPPIK